MSITVCDDYTDIDITCHHMMTPNPLPCHISFGNTPPPPTHPHTQVCCLAPSQAPCRDLASSSSSSSSSTGALLPTARLRALATDPARVAGYLALDTTQRSQWLAGAVTRMGLLLPKYEAVPAARAQVDAIADEVAARGLT
jgi:hypothetical protein